MAGRIARLKEWTKYHLSPLKIDFMSLNRLRESIHFTSEIPEVLPYTSLYRKNLMRLQTMMKNDKRPFEQLRVEKNPFGTTPLTAIVFFHTDEPCRVSYTVKGKTEQMQDVSFITTQAVTMHIVTINMLYENYENQITLQLLAEDNHVLATKEIIIATEKLPNEVKETTDTFYPCIKDADSEYRYVLMVPCSQYGMVPLTEHRFFMADGKLRVPSGNKPLPTHLYEFDLLGRFYHTYYIGCGISGSFCEKEPKGHLYVQAYSPNDADGETVLEVCHMTGAVEKIHNMDTISFPMPQTTLSIKDLEPFMQPSLDMPEEDGFIVSGWLQSPSEYKGASVTGSSNITLEYVEETYQLTFSLSGDTLLIETPGNNIEEILFSKYDKIYQLDLTYTLQDENPFSHYPYTLAVPFTEMYSGTYSITIRFANGKQEILTNILTLSRTRGDSAS